MKLKNYLRDLTPPIVWRLASKLCPPRDHSGDRGFQHGSEQPPEFYDGTFNESEHWTRHYTQSRYYSLWTIIADRIRRAGVARVLDIGCGPGQVACLLRDVGTVEYQGLDFSSTRVARARAICSEYEFHVEDVFETDLFDTFQYDCVLMLEFLEHVERDLDLLERIRPGALVIGTVPNFAAAAHVRFFGAAEEVRSRYEAALQAIDVTTVLANERGKAFFVIEGVR